MGTRRRWRFRRFSRVLRAGARAWAVNARRAGGPRWTHADVDPYLRERGEVELADAVAAFERELKAVGFRVQGGGTGAAPSYSVWGSTADGRDIRPFSVYFGDCSLGCNFEWVERSGRQAQERFLDDLVAAGAKLQRDVIAAAGFRRRPGTPLSILVDPTSRAAVVSAARRLSSPEDD